MQVLGIKSHDNETLLFEEEVGFEHNGRTHMDIWFADVLSRTREALEASLFIAVQREHDLHAQDMGSDMKESAQMSVLVAKVCASHACFHVGTFVYIYEYIRTCMFYWHEIAARFSICAHVSLQSWWPIYVYLCMCNCTYTNIYACTSITRDILR
jgi:hypothetical protein